MRPDQVVMEASLRYSLLASEVANLPEDTLSDARATLEQSLADARAAFHRALEAVQTDGER